MTFAEVLKLPVLSVMGTGRALEDTKDQKSNISASICHTEKYNLSNGIRISQATHFHTHLFIFCVKFEMIGCL